MNFRMYLGIKCLVGAFLTSYGLIVDFNDVRAEVLARLEAAREEILGGELAVVVETVEHVLPLVRDVVQIGVEYVQVFYDAVYVHWSHDTVNIGFVCKLYHSFFSLEIVQGLILFVVFAFQDFAVVSGPIFVLSVIVYHV